MAFSACASAGPTLMPTQVASVSKTIVRSYVPERQIKVDSYRSNGGASFGLIGGLASAISNNSREKTAAAVALPLQKQTQDVDQQTVLWSVLEPAVRGVSWLKALEVERKPIRIEGVTDGDVVGNALLRIGSDVLLSANCTTLNVQSAVSFYEANGSGRPVGAVTVYYRSGTIGQVESEQAVARWAANGGQAYRNALWEGAVENAKLIRIALQCMGGMECGAATGHHLRFRLGGSLGSVGSREGVVDEDGSIMEEGAYRVTFRGSDGSMYSVPKSSIESQIGHGPPPVFVPSPNVPSVATSAGNSPAGPPLSGLAPIPMQPTGTPLIAPTLVPPPPGAGFRGPEELPTVETQTVVPLGNPEPAESRPSSPGTPHSRPRKRVVAPN